MEGCDYRNHNEPTFQEMKLLTLRDINFLETAKFMHHIQCKQNYSHYNCHKTPVSIYQHYTRYIDNDNHYNQPIFHLQEKQ